MQHIVVRMWMAPAVRLSRCLKLLPMTPLPAEAQCEGNAGIVADRPVTLLPAKTACGGKCDPANCDKADCKKAECPKARL